MDAGCIRGRKARVGWIAPRVLGRAGNGVSVADIGWPPGRSLLLFTVQGQYPASADEIFAEHRAGHVNCGFAHVAEHGCKWRGLPKRFDNWHTIYTRMNRWAKAGVLDRMFEELQRSQVVRIRIEAVSLDSTSIKVHPDGTGALKKTAHRPSASPGADGTPRFMWLPRMLERP
jgi:transposase